MTHKVSLNYFSNGYSVATGGSCLDLPVAVILGNIFEPSYLYYLATKSAATNWGFDKGCWPDATAKILSGLGFNFHTVEVNTWPLFLKEVKEAINNNTPLLVPVSYHKLFYCVEPIIPCSHILMVTGYDEENQKLFIVDCNIVEHGLILPNKDYTLYQIPITFDIFEGIWKGSQLFLRESDNPIAYNLYSISADVSDAIQKDALTVLTNILDSINKTDKRESLLSFYISRINNFEDVDEFSMVRRTTLLQLKSLFDLVEKAISDKVLFESWAKEKDNFINLRKILIGRLEIDYRKGKLLTEEEQDKIRDMAIDQEKKLLDGMLRIIPH